MWKQKAQMSPHCLISTITSSAGACRHLWLHRSRDLKTSQEAKDKQKWNFMISFLLINCFPWIALYVVFSLVFRCFFLFEELLSIRQAPTWKTTKHFRLQWYMLLKFNTLATCKYPYHAFSMLSFHSYNEHVLWENTIILRKCPISWLSSLRSLD